MQNRRRSTVLVVLLVSVLVTSCSGIKEPEVTLTDIDFVGLTSEGLRFEIMALVENPNDFGASVGHLEYRVFGDGVELAEGERDEAVPIPARESVEVPVPFVLRWEGGKTILGSLFDENVHEWRVEGEVELIRGAIAKTFKFEESGDFESPSGVADM